MTNMIETKRGFWSAQFVCLALLVIGSSACAGVTLGRTSQHEWIQQDFRYVSCSESVSSGSLTAKHCPAGVGVLATSKCVAGHRLESLLGHLVYLLRNEYAPELRDDSRQRRQLQQAEGIELGPEPDVETLFAQLFSSGRLSMDGNVDFGLYPNPKDHSTVFVTATGTFQARKDAHSWAIGQFYMPVTQYGIAAIFEHRYLDLEVQLLLAPLPSRVTWEDRADSVYEQELEEWGGACPAPKSPEDSDVSADGKSAGGPKLPAAPKSAAVPKDAPVLDTAVPVSPEPASGGTCEEMPTGPPSKNPDSRPSSVRYRIFMRPHPKKKHIVEIDYDRGHIISTSEGVPIGCLFFDPSNGIKLIDFKDLSKLRRYDDIRLEDVPHTSQSVAPAFDSDSLCRFRLIEGTPDSCEDFVPGDAASTDK